MWLGGEQKQFCLHWPSFIIAFALGILYVYLTVPPKHVLLKHPTPFNAGKVTYHDDTGTCFVFKAKELPCPQDPALVADHPIVTSMVNDESTSIT